MTVTEVPCRSCSRKIPEKSSMIPLFRSVLITAAQRVPIFETMGECEGCKQVNYCSDGCEYEEGCHACFLSTDPDQLPSSTFPVDGCRFLSSAIRCNIFLVRKDEKVHGCKNYHSNRRRCPGILGLSTGAARHPVELMEPGADSAGFSFCGYFFLDPDVRNQHRRLKHSSAAVTPPDVRMPLDPQNS